MVISSFRQLLTEKEGSNPVKVTFLAKSKTAYRFLPYLLIISQFWSALLVFDYYFILASSYVSTVCSDI